MILRVVLLFIMATCISPKSFGGFIIDVGSHTLQANTAGQRVDIFLTSNSDSDLPLKGMNFRAVLGDGSGTQGRFQDNGNTVERDGIIVQGGGYFWDLRGSTPAYPNNGVPAVLEMSVNFNSGTHAVGNGNTVKLATVLIDTTGLFSGTYGIDFRDAAGTGVGPLQLILSDNTTPHAGSPGFSVSNGSFTIAAVPEPSSLFLLAAAAFGLGAYRPSRTKSRI